MEKLKKVIEQYGRWSEYSMYADRIEAHIDSDFSLCIENSKSLIEGISKQICKEKNVILSGDESFNRLVKIAFDAIGHRREGCINIIGGSLSAIAHQLGDLRTAIGATSHGMTSEELKDRNDSLNTITKEFLIDSVEIIGCFLIRNFENENPRILTSLDNESLSYENAQDFNEFWDELFGDFEMGDYSYTASEVLYNVDNEAYINEYKGFKENQELEHD
ncbi:hypothetical protein SDC9_81601 [bioreactor metagenome]|uniref:Uncharacterized protein n=1 Tax=bioreactor metagenome TaxID=1076179 RepID=A0A644Z4T2_9ZZZZ